MIAAARGARPAPTRPPGPSRSPAPDHPRPGPPRTPGALAPLPGQAGCTRRRRKQSGAECERCAGATAPRGPVPRRLPPGSASRLNCGVRIDWECKWQLKCNLHSQQEQGEGERGTGRSAGQEGCERGEPRSGAAGRGARHGHQPRREERARWAPSDGRHVPKALRVIPGDWIQVWRLSLLARPLLLRIPEFRGVWGFQVTSLTPPVSREPQMQVLGASSPTAQILFPLPVRDSGRDKLGQTPARKQGAFGARLISK